jgi:hypothetical protein
MGKRVLIGVVAGLTAVVGTGVASAAPSPTWGPVTCAVGAGGQTTAVWNKAKVTAVTLEWFASGANPFTDQPLATVPVDVTTHAPKGSISVNTPDGVQAGTQVFANFQTADFSLLIPGDSPCG